MVKVIASSRTFASILYLPAFKSAQALSSPFPQAFTTAAGLFPKPNNLRWRVFPAGGDANTVDVKAAKTQRSYLY